MVEVSIESILAEENRKRNKVSNLLDGFGYEKNYEEHYNNLVKATGFSFFETKKDVQVVAALIGFNLNCNNLDKIKNYTLKSKLSKLSPVDYSEYYHLIYSVSLCIDSENIDNDTIVQNFNKCASLGIEKLIEILDRDGEGHIRNFEDFLMSPQDFLEDMFSDKNIFQKPKNDSLDREVQESEIILKKNNCI